jgi:hypothetical protein
MAMATTTRPPAVAAGVQLGLGLLWLAATMWAAHASILANADDAAVALSSAAGALPGVIAAALFAGACAGFAAVRFVPFAVVGWRPRLLTGLGAGAVIGAIAAGLILWGYGTNDAVAALAVTVGIAGLLGGAAAVLPDRVLAAGLAATTAVFLAGLALGVLNPSLNTLFLGSDADVAARADASTGLAYLQSAITGALAGFVAYLMLRREARPWPWFLGAGAVPGVLLLVAELLTHTGGASLQRTVKAFSPFDEALVEFTDFARLRHALVVLFVGGIVAMIAVGRTLTRPVDHEDEPARS